MELDGRDIVDDLVFDELIRHAKGGVAIDDGRGAVPTRPLTSTTVVAASTVTGMFVGTSVSVRASAPSNRCRDHARVDETS